MLETLFSGGQNHAVKLITIAGKDNCGHDNGACKQNLCTEGSSHIILYRSATRTQGASGVVSCAAAAHEIHATRKYETDNSVELARHQQ